jgi:hypothetical protein
MSRRADRVPVALSRWALDRPPVRRRALGGLHAARQPTGFERRNALRAIAAALNERGISSVAGSGRWYHTQVARVLARLLT